MTDKADFYDSIARAAIIRHDPALAARAFERAALATPNETRSLEYLLLSRITKEEFK